MAEMTEHLENLQRVKSKMEKDKQVMKAEIEDLSASMETIQKSKVRPRGGKGETSFWWKPLGRLVSWKEGAKRCWLGESR